MNYWQNKKQSGHKTPGTPTHPMLCTPHECPNQQTPQQFFKNYKTTPKNMTSIRSKKHIRYQPRTPTPHQKKGGTSALSQHPVSPIHIITTQHTNMLRLKRIEQSTLLSSQTTHHTNNNTPSESSSAGQWYCHSILSDNLNNYTRFYEETQAKNFMFYITQFWDSFKILCFWNRLTDVRDKLQIMHCIVGFAAKFRGFYPRSPRRLIQLYRGFPCFANRDNM